MAKPPRVELRCPCCGLMVPLRLLLDRLELFEHSITSKGRGRIRNEYDALNTARRAELEQEIGAQLSGEPAEADRSQPAYGWPAAKSLRPADDLVRARKKRAKKSRRKQETRALEAAQERTQKRWRAKLTEERKAPTAPAVGPEAITTPAVEHKRSAEPAAEDYETLHARLLAQGNKRHAKMLEQLHKKEQRQELQRELRARRRR